MKGYDILFPSSLIQLLSQLYLLYILHIGDDKDKRIDKTVPQISSGEPSHHLYIFGRKLIPLKNTIIIGKAFVKIDANDNMGIDEVKIYIDGVLKATIKDKPYEWQWNKATIGKHEIKAIAYDNAGNDAIITEKIWIINI